jgi:hypothetical protein
LNVPTATHELVTILNDDRPGELAKAVTAIANALVNIEGYCELDGELHLVTRDPDEARKALETVGFRVDKREIFVIDAEDKPGFLAKVLRRISAEEVNIIATYSLAQTRIAFSVDRPARIKEILPELAAGASRTR